MKKILSAVLVGLVTISLGACGSESSSSALEGKWTKSKQESKFLQSICNDSYTFGEETVDIKRSDFKGGKSISGTYENVEDNDYKFEYGGVSDMYTLKVKDNAMTVRLNNGDNVCKYTKAE